MLRVRIPCTAALAVVSFTGLLARAQNPAPVSSPPLTAAEMPAPTGALSCGDGTGCSTRWRPGRNVANCIRTLAGDGTMPALGASLYACGRTQVANGAAGRLMLYNYDFVEGSSELNVRGRQQLRHFAALMDEYPFPLIVEWNPCQPHLDEGRRATVLAELSHAARRVLAPDRVVVGPPIAYGSSGLEAEAVYRRLILQAQTGGPGPIGGAMGIGLGGVSPIGVAPGFTGAGGGMSGLR